MSGGITVEEFKHIPGLNDAEYIKKLEELRETDKRIINDAVAKIKKLSAQLKEQPKHGKWIHHEGGYSDHYECTACGKAIVLTGRWNFCPNCGADMRGGVDG